MEQTPTQLKNSSFPAKDYQMKIQPIIPIESVKNKKDQFFDKNDQIGWFFKHQDVGTHFSDRVGR